MKIYAAILTPEEIYAAILTPKDREVLVKHLKKIPGCSDCKTIPNEPRFQTKFVATVAALGLVLAAVTLLNGMPLFAHSKVVISIASLGITFIAMAILWRQHLDRKACMEWVRQNKPYLDENHYFIASTHFAAENHSKENDSNLLNDANKRLNNFMTVYRPDLN